MGKESACNAGDTEDVGSILGLGRCHEGGNDNNSSTFAWKIPVTEVSGGLQSKGSLRVGHDWAWAQKYLIASDALQIVKLWEILSNTLMLYLIGKCAFINWEG